MNNGPIWINMSCSYQKRSWMPFDKPRFSILNLWSNYHKLPLKEGDKVKMVFWGIDPCGKDYLYQWHFLPFSLKNTPMKFQRIMNQMLANIGFAKC